MNVSRQMILVMCLLFVGCQSPKTTSQAEAAGPQKLAQKVSAPEKGGVPLVWHFSTKHGTSWALNEWFYARAERLQSCEELKAFRQNQLTFEARWLARKGTLTLENPQLQGGSDSLKDCIFKALSGQSPTPGKLAPEGTLRLYVGVFSEPEVARSQYRRALWAERPSIKGVPGVFQKAKKKTDKGSE